MVDKLNVDLVKDINEEEARKDSGFDELVLPEGYREIILALVQNHSRLVGDRRGDPSSALTQSFSMDLVKGKGKGTIILLHGAPGVGKTSTAETVAAYTRRPL